MNDRVRSVALVLLLGPLVLPQTAEAQKRDPIAVFEKQCPKGERADEYPGWKWIANNAVRTADEYAMDRNPQATFVTAEVETVFQFAGEYAGEYLVKLLQDGPAGTSFAMLRPSFPFCVAPSSLDDSRTDLFTVVVAKFNGKPF